MKWKSSLNECKIKSTVNCGTFPVETNGNTKVIDVVSLSGGADMCCSCFRSCLLVTEASSYSVLTL